MIVMLVAMVALAVVVVRLEMGSSRGRGPEGSSRNRWARGEVSDAEKGATPQNIRNPGPLGF